MKFVLKPSLEHIALVKIAVSLWRQNDVRALIAKLYSPLDFCNLYSSRSWKKIENHVIEKLSHLSLPQLLKEKLLGVIKPIGLQLVSLMKFHNRYLYINLPAELCWTPEGTINRKKTAEMLVKDESLDISIRYKLACIYCLEDYILQFWTSMPEDLKENILESALPDIINIWSHNMKSRESEYAAYAAYKDNFFECVDQGNKAAAEFFLQKLTPSERRESLIETAEYRPDTDVLFFLISEMDEEQQIEAFKNDPCGILKCFLQWPLQIFFTRIGNCMLDFLSENHYEHVLSVIIEKVTDGYSDFDYQMIFREFWQKSPNVLKSFITNEIDESWLLPSLFDIKDKENIRLILKDTTLIVKEKFINSHTMNLFCQRSIRADEWDSLEFFIRGCLPSQNEMLKFKEEFENSIISPYFKEHFATKKYKWYKLFWLFDDSIFKYDKRSVEEEENSSSKWFRHLQ